MTFTTTPPARRPRAPRIGRLHALGFGLMLGSLTLAGCNTVYRTPDAAGLSGQQLVRLRVKGNEMDLTLTRLDGREINRPAGDLVELAPGAHVVAANLASASSEPIVLEFNAEPGHRYTLDGSIVDGSMFVFRWTADITDDQTRQLVSRRPDGGTAPLWAKR